MKRITVLLCTHNPRADYLAKTVAGLREQTLGVDDWQLVVVDNNSEPPVDAGMVAGWHPGGVVLREGRPGKVHAMVTGLAAAEGELIVTVDDDNILDPEYLANAVALGEAWPRLAVFSASIRGEFEGPVPGWAETSLSLIAVRELEGDYWGNQAAAHVFPIGAGMVFRREMGERFVAETRSARFPEGLCRQEGNSLAGTEDTLFGYLAIEAGYGCGAFRSLRMRHQIAARRLTIEYMEGISWALGYAHALLARIYEGTPLPVPGRVRELIEMVRLRRRFRGRENAERYRIARGQWRGRRDAAVAAAGRGLGNGTKEGR